MTNYITDTFDKFVDDIVAKLYVNDDLYDECLKAAKANKNTEDKLEQLVNDVAYQEIAYKFRAKKLDSCGYKYGKMFVCNYDPMIDAMMQLYEARENLMEYCQENEISYLELLK